MSDPIKHECGFILIRLLKPLSYYQEKYGTWRFGLNKLYLMMEKQRNRGQDGAGVVSLKLDIAPGKKYLSRSRSNASTPIVNVFAEINSRLSIESEGNQEDLNNPEFAKNNLPFAGELYLGHLRYGTFGRNNIENVHPVMRENNWKSRNLVIAGNFNLTNVDELFKHLMDLGQHPKDYSDTVTILEKVGHFLDEENQRLFRQYKNEGYANVQISDLIAESLDVRKILEEASKYWDGGYVISGLIGHGDAFVFRDPNGIRPAFFHQDDEFVIAASERSAIQTVMNIKIDEVQELKPGHALIIKKNGKVSEDVVRIPQANTACSFERIYFSRGSDEDIYKERKKLGELIVPDILKSVNYDIENTVFSFIPNTAESAFYGMIKGVEDWLIEEKQRLILDKGTNITPDELRKILSLRPRVEKVAIKDVKLRTFISADKGREDLVGHVYDITYGTIRRGIDNLVIIDDSIVRGTTLKQSILKILDRLGPKKIVIVSSSPQIRYPDCYGIDMAKLGDFIAFQAGIELLKDQGKEDLIQEVYLKSKEQENLPKEDVINYVKHIFREFTPEQVSVKVAQLLKSESVKAEVEIVYQSVENLHKACPNHPGDWYFTGNYPTPGGNKVVTKSFINYIEGKDERAY
ncbi:MAG TPA: amidophosphoribosyltransferase [Marinilabiliales bacterium]|jgi:amidophosphoribosyltransferase|nr:MAG: amidophosphoribosyltransferase [Bacteroidetes bacterium GWA2_40_14]OFX63107.1 MAG: amidophosphoribosyltransferase [Bacteroidetes bacterium GWC2_40_13]OFX75747.1 MAG: amidophosphoribosyltransferase [Bacteroidetes bacterium GWD2_40_43]OFX94980.1 MAG: amidophosphoribosyltransferase [Bacteroidetes bacterium GWE2_40_63]OFY23492.1 MAG: amidophosphoribosyltransferase [Bacteroidetes bacterium GWF2_40_13]OFZ29383.1 MAG: amidophosphoribosyltransferase [Bacteroidetes bacterium RIFOXYC2_FULL_40_12